ncbi:MAG: SDR family oxidoreductase [Alphaproteobacteria bacterium]
MKKGWMEGKRGVIMGLANEYSLAYGISKYLYQEGAKLAFTYQGDAIYKRIKPIAKSFNSDVLFPCDVSDSKDIKKVFKNIKESWGSIDFVLHSIAFAEKDDLKGRYIDTPRENFLKSLDISCYSFTKICKEAAPLMINGGAFLTLSYYGAEKVIPHYNIMGVAKAALEASVKYLAVDLGSLNIRVNALSAGPAKTLASSAIGDFKYILKWNCYNSPLKRNTTLDDVGRAGFYLLSDLSSGVTGEVHHVDSGYHVVGMKSADAPDLTVQKSCSNDPKKA